MSEPQVYTHGDRLARKAAKDPKLASALVRYHQWKDASLSIVGRSNNEIRALTDLLNAYKDAVEPIFDGRSNSAQEGLQPSILEEFFGYLFSNVHEEVGQDLLRRPASSFIGLIFNPRDARALIEAPDFTLRAKDHDFVLGSLVTMTIQAEGSAALRSDQLVVPAVALECKRYLERN